MPDTYYPSVHEPSPGTSLPRGLESVIEMPNGLLLNDRRVADRFEVTSMSGVGDADVLDAREGRPEVDGEMARNSFYGGRTLSIQGKLVGESIEKIRDLESRLVESSGPLEERVHVLRRVFDDRRRNFQNASSVINHVDGGMLQDILAVGNADATLLAGRFGRPSGVTLNNPSAIDYVSPGWEGATAPSFTVNSGASNLVAVEPFSIVGQGDDNNVIARAIPVKAGDRVFVSAAVRFPSLTGISSAQIFAAFFDETGEYYQAQINNVGYLRPISLLAGGTGSNATTGALSANTWYRLWGWVTAPQIYKRLTVRPILMVTCTPSTVVQVAADAFMCDPNSHAELTYVPHVDGRRIDCGFAGSNHLSYGPLYEANAINDPCGYSLLAGTAVANQWAGLNNSAANAAVSYSADSRFARGHSVRVSSVLPSQIFPNLVSSLNASNRHLRVAPDDTVGGSATFTIDPASGSFTDAQLAGMSVQFGFKLYTFAGAFISDQLATTTQMTASLVGVANRIGGSVQITDRTAFWAIPYIRFLGSNLSQLIRTGDFRMKRGVQAINGVLEVPMNFVDGDSRLGCWLRDDYNGPSIAPRRVPVQRYMRKIEAIPGNEQQSNLNCSREFMLTLRSSQAAWRRRFDGGPLIANSIVGNGTFATGGGYGFNFGRSFLPNLQLVAGVVATQNTASSRVDFTSGSTHAYIHPYPDSRLRTVASGVTVGYIMGNGTRQIDIILKWIDANNYLFVRMEGNATITFTLREVFNGVATTLGTSTGFADTTAVGNTRYFTAWITFPTTTTWVVKARHNTTRPNGGLGTPVTQEFSFSPIALSQRWMRMPSIGVNTPTYLAGIHGEPGFSIATPGTGWSMTSLDIWRNRSYLRMRSTGGARAYPTFLTYTDPGLTTPKPFTIISYKSAGDHQPGSLSFSTAITSTAWARMFADTENLQVRDDDLLSYRTFYRDGRKATLLATTGQPATISTWSSPPYVDFDQQYDIVYSFDPEMAALPHASSYIVVDRTDAWR